MKGFTDRDLELAEEVAKYYADPLGFVYFAFPWGKPGYLEHHTGPDDWQEKALIQLGQEVSKRGFDGRKPVAPIRAGWSSGHGIGKGVLCAMVSCWILSTRMYSQGTVTANSHTQLQTKTWAGIQRWLRMCITGHWFDIGQERIKALIAPESWFVTPQSCKEENSEAFAGQHAENSTSWYLFDEASAIPDKIWEVAEGGLTDGEPMFLVFGNPTKSTGKFHEVMFGANRGKWSPQIIDSRTCKFSNKALIDEWVEEHGEDSDFVRVRVRGLPPRASDAQFIAQDLVYQAQTRMNVTVLSDEPLVAGLDVARGGFDNSVIRLRQGSDASFWKPIRIPGEECRDSMRLVSVCGDLLDRSFPCRDGVNRKLSMLFIDETGIGGPIYDRLVQLGHEDRVTGVGFGKRSPDDKFDNMRAYIWGKMRDWLPRGSIDKDPVLESDLVGPGYGHTKRDKLLLESKESMKKRGLASPDDGDALAVTFAAPVVSREVVMPMTPVMPMAPGEGPRLGWMG